MFVYMKRIHKTLSVGVAFIAALILSNSIFAQNVGGVIKGTPTQQGQFQSSGSQPINQNGRLLLEMQALREEMASLRNQVEQQGYQLRQLQNGQQADQSSLSQPATNSTYGNTSVGSNATLGEIPAGTTSNQQQTYQSTVPSSSAQSGSAVNGSTNSGVNFPLLPQDQVTGQAGSQQQAVPQLVPQAQPQFQQQPQAQTAQRPQLTPEAQLLEGGNKGIKTNLNELELYNKGVDKLTTRDYKAAASIFSAQLQNFPKGEKAGDGYFWLAETFYILDDLDSSAKSYQSLIDLFPRHVRAPKALLKLVSVHQDREDDISAKIALNVLVKKYPNSEEANSAKSKHAALL